jgi:hypothetical protein
LVNKKVILFNFLARDGNTPAFVEKFIELMDILEQNEPKNIKLALDIAKLFSRIAG